MQVVNNVFSLSIISIAIIIIIVTVLVVATGKIRLNTHWSWQIAGIYLVLLLIPLFLYYTVAEPGSEPIPDDVYSPDRAQWAYPMGALHSHVMEGDHEEIEDIIIEETWSFSYEKEHLTIMSGSRHRVPSVFVKQKEENDGIINAKSLTLFISLAEIPELELSESRLTVSAEKTEIIHSGRDFTTTQLTGEAFGIDSRYFFESAEQVLYLEIPAGLELTTGEHIWINYKK